MCYKTKQFSQNRTQWITQICEKNDPSPAKKCRLPFITEKNLVFKVS